MKHDREALDHSVFEFQHSMLLAKAMVEMGHQLHYCSPDNEPLFSEKLKLWIDLLKPTVMIDEILKDTQSSKRLEVFG